MEVEGFCPLFVKWSSRASSDARKVRPLDSLIVSVIRDTASDRVSSGSRYLISLCFPQVLHCSNLFGHASLPRYPRHSQDHYRHVRGDWGGGVLLHRGNGMQTLYTRQRS